MLSLDEINSELANKTVSGQRGRSSKRHKISQTSALVCDLRLTRRLQSPKNMSVSIHSDWIVAPYQEANIIKRISSAPARLYVCVSHSASIDCDTVLLTHLAPCPASTSRNRGHSGAQPMSHPFYLMGLYFRIGSHNDGQGSCVSVGFCLIFVAQVI